MAVAPLDKRGGDCHLAAYFIMHRENNESIAWRRRKDEVRTRLATNERSLPFLLGQESVSSLSELFIPDPPQFRLGLWVALLAE